MRVEQLTFLETVSEIDSANVRPTWLGVCSCQCTCAEAHVPSPKRTHAIRPLTPSEQVKWRSRSTNKEHRWRDRESWGCQGKQIMDQINTITLNQNRTILHSKGCSSTFRRDHNLMLLPRHLFDLLKACQQPHCFWYLLSLSFYQQT